MILQLYPPRLIRGTIDSIRREAVSAYQTGATIARSTDASAQRREGWATRRRNRAEALAVRRREWAADLAAGNAPREA